MNIKGLANRIKARRLELGLSDKDVSDQVGIGQYSYGDIEFHDDEFITQISLGEAKRVCAVLGLDLNKLLAIEKSSSGSELRNELLHHRRIELGVSVQDLSDKIGFYPEVIEKIEKDANGVDDLPIEVVNDIAKLLELPLEKLLRSR